jgi:hypothetical protein
LSDTRLWGADFSGAFLTGANFTDAELNDVKLPTLMVTVEGVEAMHGGQTMVDRPWCVTSANAGLPVRRLTAPAAAPRPCFRVRCGLRAAFIQPTNTSTSEPVACSQPTSSITERQRQ